MATCNTNSIGGTFNDLFNNSSNNYVYPALSPCAGTEENSYLEFTDKGIGIVSGSDILAKIDFSDIQIPVSAYSTETKIIGPGEVVYIPGLTKGLTKKQQGFSMPYLVSTNESLNPLFLGIDLSINYYKNFKYTYDNISVVADYGSNLNIQDAINIALGNKGIKAEASYDPSIFKFISTLDGYEFNVSNVILSIIDTSLNSSSPFDHLENAEEYTLAEDPSASITSSKYPNGAVQGIIMKGMYPSNTTMCPYDHWLYINHVMDPVVIYEPVEIINFLFDVSSNLKVGFDPSVSFGILEPSLALDFDVKDSSSNIYDVSLLSFSVTDITTSQRTIDGSIEGIVIDGSVINDKEITDCSINDSSIGGSNIFDGSIGGSILGDTYILGSPIWDSSILGSDVVNSTITNSYINPSRLENCDVSVSTVLSSSLQWGSIWGSIVQDSSFKDLSVSNLEPPTLLKSYDFDNSLGDGIPEPSTWIPIFTDGNVDSSALVLNGSGFIKTNFKNPDTFTLGFWYRNRTNLSGAVIFSMQDQPDNGYDNGFNIFVESTGELKVRFVYGGTPNTSLAITTLDNNYHFIVLQHDNSLGYWSLYLDDMSTPLWEENNPIYSIDMDDSSFNAIGDWYNLPPLNPVNGDIFGFRIYENVLNQDQRNSLYSTGSVSYTDASISGSYFQNSAIEYNNILNSYAKDSSITKSSVEDSQLYNIIVDTTYLTRVMVGGDSSTSYLDNTVIEDSSLSNSVLTDSSINNSYIKDSSIANVEGANNIFDTCTIDDASLSTTDILASSLISLWGMGLYINRSDVSTFTLWDSSSNYSWFYDGDIYDSYLEDSSVYSSKLERVFTERVVIGQSDVSSSIMKETFFGQTIIMDSSILGGSIINNESSIYNSFIDNSWTNVYKLTVNASLGIYEYVTLEDDPSLNLNRVEITSSEIWDSSINNAILTDCSIYRCHLAEDVSLYGCTIYNTVLDPLFYESTLDNNRIIMVDPSINCEITWDEDSSIYYKKYTKRLDVGMNGASTETVMSAGDYLDWITVNDYWNKFGELYAWTAAADACATCDNLIEGFYIFNPHTFNVKIEYMLIV